MQNRLIIGCAAIDLPKTYEKPPRRFLILGRSLFNMLCEKRNKGLSQPIDIAGSNGVDSVDNNKIFALYSFASSLGAGIVGL